MTLREYLASTKQKQQDFASKVGVSKGFITHMLQRRRFPSYELALRIEIETNKAVTVRDLLPDEHPVLKLLQCSSAPKDERNAF